MRRLGILDCSGPAPHVVFIIGAPRTGSTYFYQLVVAGFGLPYFSNLTNRFFATHPLIGLWLQSAEASRDPIRFVSSYGKTPGLFQPSEASAIMGRWFGGGHPSQTVSDTVLPGREAHLMRTLNAAERLFGRPLVIKNAWNCFRLDYLARALPVAGFIWIRRDIRAAAGSDLAARYAVHGDPHAWNSATPADVAVLRARPYAEQVVENQFAFNEAIRKSLQQIDRRRWTSLWYEDVCSSPSTALQALGRALPLVGKFAELTVNEASQASGGGLSEADRDDIRSFVEAQAARFADHLYRLRA